MRVRRKSSTRSSTCSSSWAQPTSRPISPSSTPTGSRDREGRTRGREHHPRSAVRHDRHAVPEAPAEDGGFQMLIFGDRPQSLRRPHRHRARLSRQCKGKRPDRQGRPRRFGAGRPSFDEDPLVPRARTHRNRGGYGRRHHLRVRNRRLNIGDTIADAALPEGSMRSRSTNRPFRCTSWSTHRRSRAVKASSSPRVRFASG